MSSEYIKILLPKPFDRPFDYMVESGDIVELGDFVSVPFGTKELRGVVWEISQPSIDKAKIKPIISVKRHIEPMQQNLRDFIDWVSAYSCSPKGSVLAMSMSVSEVFAEPKKLIKYQIGDISNLKITTKRQEILDILSAKPIDLIELTQDYNISKSVISAMVKNGSLIKIESEAECKSPKNIQLKPNEINFSDEQQIAAKTLISKIKAAKYSATVLDGVTGSGKTEVYFEAVRAALEQGKQALILLPEIVLTTQVIERFERHLGITPTQWHSNLTPKQRRENWLAINSGSAQLIVAARSGLFLPYKSLGVIIVDEEHESAFKQEEGVIYHGRDMAVMRAKFENIACILASATPSIETSMNIEAQKYDHIRMHQRYGEAVMPEIKAIDMRLEKLNAQHFLSDQLKSALTHNIEAGEQSLLFLNRRGYAPLTLCRKCGYRFQCDNCSAWLVEHRCGNSGRRSYLQCHQCGIIKNIPRECPECESDEGFASCGPGVQRLEEEVRQFLPDANITIMTSDLVANIKESERALSDISSGKTDIIIGTQMVAKGHHFPNLTLVGIVDADMGLEGGDLRAAERSYQLLQQVSGRAGRAKLKGQVLIQSYMPENAVIGAMLSGDRDKFIAQEIKRRKAAKMPPFMRLASIILSGRDEAVVKNTASELVRCAPNAQGVRILGPAPAIIYRLRGNFRYRILIMAEKNINIQKLATKIITNIKTPSTVKIKTDIDPYSFM